MKLLSILIIDDASLVRVHVIHLLKKTGKADQIFQAGSCEEGIRILKKENPDIVILDINLPDCNGIKLLGYIKENNPTTKTIVLTNYGHRKYRDACKELGAYDFIDKALEFDRIPALITAIRSN